MSDSKLQLANSPLDAFVDYFLEAKPYHTKLLEVIETYRINESMVVSLQEDIFKEITKINDPLCKLVGFGVNYDDDCGYDALSCCDLFDCVTGGYGFIFDNSDLLVDQPITEINKSEKYVRIAGNFTADKRIPILEIPTIDSVLVRGDHTATFNKHRVFVTTDVQHFEITGNTEDSIFIEGDHYDFFKNRSKFHIVGTNTQYNGTYHYYSVSYDPSSDTTQFSISSSVSVNNPDDLLPVNDLIGLSIVLRNINNPNNAPNYESPNIGIYQVVNHSYDSTTDTTTIEVNVDDTPFNSDSSGLNQYQLGSIQLREGLKYPRWVSLEDEVSGIPNENDHKILFSMYVPPDAEDHPYPDSTVLYLSGDLDDYDEHTLSVKFYGYFFEAGYDSAEECTTPKDTNVHTGIEERVYLEAEDVFVLGKKLMTFGTNELAFDFRTSRMRVGGGKNNPTLGSSPFTEVLDFEDTELLGENLPFPLINQNIPQDVICNREVYYGPWEWVSDAWWSVIGIGGEQRSLYGWGVSWFFMFGAGVGNGSGNWNLPIKLFEGEDYEFGWERVEHGGFMNFTAGIREGKLYTWGHPGNMYWPENFGIGSDLTKVDVRKPQQLGVGDGIEEGWTDLSVNEFAAFAIRNGEAYVWGEQYYTGFSEDWQDMVLNYREDRKSFYSAIPKPSKIPLKDDWVFIEAGIDNQRLYLIDSAGRLYGQSVEGAIQGWSDDDFIAAGLTVPPIDSFGWGGYDSYLEIDNGGIIQIGVGTDYEFGWEMVSTNLDNTVGIRDGKLYYWGEGGPSSGLGEGNLWEKVLTPVQIGEYQDWTWVQLGWADAVYAIRQGKLYVWGSEVKVSNLNEIEVWEPTIPDGSGEGWEKVWHSYDYSSYSVSTGICTKDIAKIPPKEESVNNGYAYAWKQPEDSFAVGENNYKYQPFIGSNPSDMPLPAPEMINNTYDPKHNFMDGPFLDWEKIVTSALHSIALRNGNIYVWGESKLGQNGLFGYLDDENYSGINKTLTSTSLPTILNIIEEDIIDGWEDISCGALHSIGINSGKLFAWGYNNWGRLGAPSSDGVISSLGSNIIISPQQIGEGTDYEFGWEKVYTSRTKTAFYVGPSSNITELGAIEAETNFGINNGRLYTWGNNIHGMTGLGIDTGYTELPTQVGTLENWQAISTGKNNVIGIESGKLFVWGSNANNELGIDDPAITEVLVPTQITPYEDWIKVSASNNHMTALRSNGELYTWGINNYGVADRVNYEVEVISSPHKESVYSDWTDIYAGIRWNIGKRNNKLYVWGLFPRDYRMIQNQESPILREFTELLEHDWKDFISITVSEDDHVEGYLNYAIKESAATIVEI